MSDKRFSALAKDPRYRLPSKKEARTAVDPRFKTLFTDQEFRKKASVDRYGRKIKPDAGKKELERLYRLDKDDESAKKADKKVEREVVGSSDESEGGEDESEDEELVEKRDPARDGGFSGSSSSEEETSDEEEKSEEEAELADDTAGNEHTEDIPMGDVSKRIACVNLDWDNIRAADIMAVACSFAPKSGRVESVTIYPSEFGRERLQREEFEGPPREIFASSKKKRDNEDEDDDESSDDDEKIKERLLKDQAGEGEEFDTAKLRQYQLERLRYYYAVIECSDNATAKTLYDSMDGREYLSTSNFFDLRFIPDETSFDEDTPHDECVDLPQGYKPNEFRTEALTHSKVRLTWDDDDATRKEVQKRAFSRAEMDENDLQAYIGSDDSDADSISSRVSTAEQKRKAKADAKRAKAREAFGLSLEPTKSSKTDKHEVVGDMQITFTPGLSSKTSGQVFENEPQDEESTRQRYIRKEKERKQKRKERAKSRNAEEEEEADLGAKEENDDDEGFNDPFFHNPTASAAAEKSARKKAAKRAAREAVNAEAESRRAELELLMTEEGEAGAAQHFDMREIEKAEKAARKKGRKKKSEGTAAAQEDFELETSDPRFKALFESHEYAIDPTAPAFRRTKAMQGLLEEKRRKRKGDEDEEDGESRVKKVKKDEDAGGGEDDVKGLVARLKDKSKKRKAGRS
ncbi:uncharacterized protein MYCFIDRAFT_205136 [Pseudocercospora fijiensis CIRAD86]|uniref:Uncharacterized protein n=1 Tax=Pseudocercospora fijiensis (strain CIRAD86) TaxID=383855 RepID=M2ZHU4_PSEFD|nr:uncharacterized protein MYCFIDRAFT_205136 [Pseudocercospora fijiensis CIRAD86]EME78684.1 hypothetical protein MYCFIDRAFT_205136 [Pseudocercospora fijiensis CIRAD86]